MQSRGAPVALAHVRVDVVGVLAQRRAAAAVAHRLHLHQCHAACAHLCVFLLLITMLVYTRLRAFC